MGALQDGLDWFNFHIKIIDFEAVPTPGLYSCTFINEFSNKVQTLNFSILSIKCQLVL